MKPSSLSNETQLILNSGMVLCSWKMHIQCFLLPANTISDLSEKETILPQPQERPFAGISVSR